MTALRPWMQSMLLIITLALAVWFQQQRLTTANARVDLAIERQQAAEQRLTRQAVTLAELQQALDAERTAQAGLRTQQSQLRQALAARQLKIKELQRENAELREWAAQQLPDAARRLRERPAITGADGYNDWLSSRDAVPPSTGEADQ